MSEKETLPDSKKITLKEPIELDGNSYTSITLNEPTAGQIETSRKAGGGDANVIRLIALCSGTPETVVRQMKARDYREAARFCDLFF